MIVTVFRSRLMPDVREEYVALVDRMVELAATMPGYISHKGFFAEDGERVTDGRIRTRGGHAGLAHESGAPRGPEERRAKSIIPNTASRFAMWCGNPNLSVKNALRLNQAFRDAHRIIAYLSLRRRY